MSMIARALVVIYIYFDADIICLSFCQQPSVAWKGEGGGWSRVSLSASKLDFEVR